MTQHQHRPTALCTRWFVHLLLLPRQPQLQGVSLAVTFSSTGHTDSAGHLGRHVVFLTQITTSKDESSRIRCTRDLRQSDMFWSLHTETKKNGLLKSLLFDEHALHGRKRFLATHRPCDSSVCALRLLWTLCALRLLWTLKNRCYATY